MTEQSHYYNVPLVFEMNVVKENKIKTRSLDKLICSNIEETWTRSSKEKLLYVFARQAIGFITWFASILSG